MAFIHNNGPRPKPLPVVTSLREEPKVVDLIAYREMVDAGNKLAFPMLFDGMGPDPEPPPLDAEEVQLIGGELTDARTELFAAAKVSDRSSSRGLHTRLMKLVDEIDSLTVRLAEWATGDDAA
jgi:hypothetical protein